MLSLRDALPICRVNPWPCRAPLLSFRFPKACESLCRRVWIRRPCPTRLQTRSGRRVRRSRRGATGWRQTAEEDMARIVAKFGGTSVADLERIRAVAERVKREYDLGHEVAVVVSAMAGVTNDLVRLTREAHSMHDAREYDAVVSTGEQVTSGLLAICLQKLGIPARSWLGWPIPIRTDGVPGRARIEGIEGDEIVRRMAGGQVFVLAGLQDGQRAG